MTCAPTHTRYTLAQLTHLLLLMMLSHRRWRRVCSTLVQQVQRQRRCDTAGVAPQLLDLLLLLPERHRVELQQRAVAALRERGAPAGATRVAQQRGPAAAAAARVCAQHAAAAVAVLRQWCWARLRLLRLLGLLVQLGRRQAAIAAAAPVPRKLLLLQLEGCCG
jgi:hypothetical protein